MPWFKEYPYPYASVDSTPLYIIAVNDYVVRSGDVSFAKEKWEGLIKAFDFLRSTYDSNGLAQNLDFGTGWIEGGPLYAVKSEIYQAGLAAETLRALSNLAHRLGKDDMAWDLTQKFEHRRRSAERIHSGWRIPITMPSLSTKMASRWINPASSRPCLCGLGCSIKIRPVP